MLSFYHSGHIIGLIYCNGSVTVAFPARCAAQDIQGAKQAMRKAIDIAQPGDKIVALNIPKLVPEMMLSSMNDPGDATEETFAALANLPSRAGTNMQAQVKEAAEEEMKKLGKEISVDYKVTQPSGDVKSGILAACKIVLQQAEGASMLFLGPGVGGNGRELEPWADVYKANAPRVLHTCPPPGSRQLQTAVQERLVVVVRKQGVDMGEELQKADEHRILELFNDLGASLCFHKPGDVRGFLLQELQLREREGASAGNFEDAEIKAVFNLADLMQMGVISEVQARKALLSLANSQKQKEDVEAIELPPEIAAASALSSKPKLLDKTRTNRSN
ncbi:unnamed protein product [Symbiodinium natans]|uniref:Uncharacterized protein n=1 Tax=Symbiodinium natans TaxID=878477 RepID=A0A812I9F2_9DINO|nr:unnamed protein product [Symbiodinium natans]